MDPDEANGSVNIRTGQYVNSNKVLLPVVTLIIMETFIAKMRRLKRYP
ncbi:hypothetical protein NXW50_05235 [Bacteroides thetaiotaomicron]|nr:hypothetical protein [Bacteroides thetaiotaomicron]MCS2277644.1 hypothetical protein [Bacteroides thetaiotaomicron]